MGLADLHIHSIHSWDGTSAVSAILKKASHHLKLDVIAITDHDEINGALEALMLAPYYGIEVVPGIEISTRDGHLLGLYVTRKIPAGMPLIDTLLCIKDAGGIAIAAHPSASGMTNLSETVITEALNHPRACEVLVGIETYNASLVFMHSNREASKMAERLPVARTGNSDAHLLWLVGQGATYFPGKTAADLRSALINRQTSVVRGRRKSNMVMILHWLVRKTLRKAGMVSWNPAPWLALQFGKVDDPLQAQLVYNTK